MDFSSITSAVSFAGATTSIIAMGALMVMPNAAKWISKKIANFF